LNLGKLLILLILPFTNCLDWDIINPFKNIHAPDYTQILKFILNSGSYWLPHVEPGEFPFFNVFPQYMLHLKPSDA